MVVAPRVAGVVVVKVVVVGVRVFMVVVVASTILMRRVVGLVAVVVVCVVVDIAGAVRKDRTRAFSWDARETLPSRSSSRGSLLVAPSRGPEAFGRALALALALEAARRLARKVLRVLEGSPGKENTHVATIRHRGAHRGAGGTWRGPCLFFQFVGARRTTLLRY